MNNFQFDYGDDRSYRQPTYNTIHASYSISSSAIVVKKLKLAFWRKTEVIACSTSHLNPYRILRYLVSSFDVARPKTYGTSVDKWYDKSNCQLGSLGPLYQCPYQIELDRRSCPKGRYHQLWEDRFEECKDGSIDEGYPVVEINMSEAVVDLAWYLLGVAERFGMYAQLVSVCYLLVLI